MSMRQDSDALSKLGNGLHLERNIRDISKALDMYTGDEYYHFLYSTNLEGVSVMKSETLVLTNCINSFLRIWLTFKILQIMNETSMSGPEKSDGAVGKAMKYPIHFRNWYWQ